MASNFPNDPVELVENDIGYFFLDLDLLRRALTCADSNGPDREGNRGLAQVGDQFMAFVILCEGFAQKLSRKDQQDALSAIRSKQRCSELAHALRLHQRISYSERQVHTGPQASSLKYAIAAIVGAVWYDSRDYNTVANVMVQMGLVNSVPVVEQVPETDPFALNFPLVNLDLFQDDSIQPSPSGPSASHVHSFGPSFAPAQAPMSLAEPVPDSGEMALSAPAPSTSSSSTSKTRRSSKRNSPKSSESIRAVFKAKYSSERDGLPSNIQGTSFRDMEPYILTLSHITCPDDRALAMMALALCDRSAFVLMKNAIENLRSPSNVHASHIGRSMPRIQRMNAIRRLDLTIAHHRLARRLHLYQLKHEVSSTISQCDSDGFVTMIPTGSAQAPTVIRGNPRNLEKHAIATQMSDQSIGTSSVTESRTFRRIGERLEKMVHRWGRGILCMLGTAISDDRLIKFSAHTFDLFLEAANTHEGDMIRRLSLHAEKVVQLFMDEMGPSSRLRIEMVDMDELDGLMRMSDAMLDLLLSVET